MRRAPGWIERRDGGDAGRTDRRSRRRGGRDRRFDESHVSGVNNNAYSFDVTLDMDDTLEEGDVVVVRYPAVDNPDEPGEYRSRPG